MIDFLISMQHQQQQQQLLKVKAPDLIQIRSETKTGTCSEGHNLLVKNGREHGLVVEGDDSCTRGRVFKYQHGYFLHRFLLIIVFLFEKIKK